MTWYDLIILLILSIRTSGMTTWLKYIIETSYNKHRVTIHKIHRRIHFKVTYTSTKKNNNGEEENASLYDEYNEDIEVLNRKFHDPMASWMELYFSKVSNAPTFGILPISSHKYQLLTESLLHLSHLLRVFSNNSMHGIMILSQMVSWLHWKYDYTWLGCFLRLEVGVNRRIILLYKHVDSFQYAGL